MEATSKPQLPLDDTGPEGVVRALDDRLVTERVTGADEGARRGAAHRARTGGRARGVARRRATPGKRPAETVAKAVEVGARVLDSGETAANVDYVRAELER